MKKRMITLLALMLFALPLTGMASEITIWDNQAGGNNAWWKNLDEDQEVEPGAATTPGWDLEGMFYENGILSIVGEWNFITKKDGYGSGDIFISTQGPVLYGNDVPDMGANDFTNQFGYNYVFDVNWEGYANGFNTYTIYQIDENSLLSKAKTTLQKGNPVSYISGGTEIWSGRFTFEETNDVDFDGDTHYTVSNFDLTKIPGFDGSFIAHFTMECGNDVIMGQVPEPATMLLLGMGLLGIGAVGRKLPLKGN